jgi:hypothetical protein
MAYVSGWYKVWSVLSFNLGCGEDVFSNEQDITSLHNPYQQRFADSLHYGFGLVWPESIQVGRG